MKEKCKICGKRTKFMYHMNEGLYCDKDKYYGLYVQQYNLDQEMWAEKFANFRKRAKSFLILSNK